MNQIERTFVELKKESRAALMPYLPLGFPSPEVSRELVRTVAEAGADVIELGIPFSDPLADGPVIQHATQVALQNGMTLVKCLQMVAAARADGVGIPLVLMGYYNPILRFGVERLAREAHSVGADALIVPDLPLEEAGELKRACMANSLALVFLAAPTSTDGRLIKIADATTGFVYMVSLTGVTGARDNLPVELEEFVARVRAVTDKPLCVGFGISSGESAGRVARIADGVIVGSALVSRIADSRTALENAREFTIELRIAMDRQRRDEIYEER
jgi:tryptophan synthase alpha chain